MDDPNFEFDFWPDVENTNQIVSCERLSNGSVITSSALSVQIGMADPTCVFVTGVMARTSVRNGSAMRVDSNINLGTKSIFLVQGSCDGGLRSELVNITGKCLQLHV